MGMDFRIENKDAFRVVGVLTHTTTESNACMTTVPALWGEVMNEGKSQEIMELANQSPAGIMGVNVYNTDPNDPRKFDYYIASATDRPAPDNMVEYTVPAATWAVFPCKRTETASVEVRVVTEWQPTSGYELLNSGYETGEMKSGAPDLEVYTDEENAEVWAAVRKK
jgi:predicted transcriptional regulator YdeE